MKWMSAIKQFWEKINAPEPSEGDEEFRESWRLSKQGEKE